MNRTCTHAITNTYELERSGNPQSENPACEIHTTIKKQIISV